ncbi:MAG TPA: hypothetical protein VL264_01710 [Gaiella sp.]|jgi:hypothetical protein|nr:hypothetical protein [Gaiella sp.]
MQKSATVVRFFEQHRWMLRDPRFSKEARLRLTAARHAIAAARADMAKARAQHERRLAAAKQRTLAKLRNSPVKAICHVFRNYCGQALRVAQCESGYRTTAQNGQYLGMFQMGDDERRLFGHGQSALEQARAAYRYFVRSGRDWSPWSCKPWY